MVLSYTTIQPLRLRNLSEKDVHTIVAKGHQPLIIIGQVIGGLHTR